jgi:hypothetical protein
MLNAKQIFIGKIHNHQIYCEKLFAINSIHVTKKSFEN